MPPDATFAAHAGGVLGMDLEAQPFLRESESASAGSAAASRSSAALPLLGKLLTHFRVTSRHSGPNMTLAQQNATVVSGGKYDA